MLAFYYYKFDEHNNSISEKNLCWYLHLSLFLLYSFLRLPMSLVSSKTESGSNRRYVSLHCNVLNQLIGPTFTNKRVISSRSITSTNQLLENISTCSPHVLENLLEVLAEQIPEVMDMKLSPKPDSAKPTEPSALPKSFKVGSKTYSNTLTSNNSLIVAQIVDLLNIEPTGIIDFVQMISHKLINDDDEKLLNEFHLVQNGSTSLFENGQTQLLKFYSSQYIIELSSNYKLIANLLKNSRKLISSDLLTDKQIVQLKKIIQQLESTTSQFIESSIDAINFIVSQMKNLQSSDISDADLLKLIENHLSNLILDIVHCIEICIIYSSNGFTVKSITEWFKLMQSTEYFSNIIINDLESLITLQSVSSIIGLSFFDLEFNFGSLDDDDSFMNKAPTLNEITDLILNTESNPIISYAWSIILHRKNTVLEMFQDDPKSIDFKSNLDSGILKDIVDIYTSLAINANKLDIFNSLLKCYQNIKFEKPFTNILGTFITQYFPYIQQPDDYSIGIISKIMKNCSGKIISSFFENESVNQLMILLKAKMPLSLDSFVSLVSINANLAVEELKCLNSYMTILDSNQFSLQYSIDDQQPDLINLTTKVQILPPFESQNELCLILKEGTKGQILNGNLDNSESLVVFLYDYNAWSLLGRVIKNLSIELKEHDDLKFKTIDRLINLLTLVLNEFDNETINEIFNYLNEYLDDFDLIDIIFRILDQSANLKKINTITQIFKFIQSLIDNGYSHRVWSNIYKSQLFSIGKSSHYNSSNGNLIIGLLGKVVIPSGDFDSIIEFFQLGHCLLLNSLKYDPNVTIKLKSEVLNQFVLHGITIFEHFITWNFKYSYKKYKLGSLISSFFNKILIFHNKNESLEYNYHKVNEVLDLSFNNLINVFLIQFIEDLRSISFILHTMYQANASFSTINSSMDLKGYHIKQWQLNSFNLIINLIKVRKSISDKSSTLEMTFFKNIKGLINIYLFDSSLRLPILKLVKELISSNHGISLLTHLGPNHTKLFLKLMNDNMSNDFEDDELLIGVYDLFSSIMRNDQEGLSIVLITGKVNIDSIENQEQENQYSLLKILKNSLNSYQKYPSLVLLHIFDSLINLLKRWNGGLIKFHDNSFVQSVLILAFDKEFKREDGNKMEIIYNSQLKCKMIEILSLLLTIYHNGSKECEKMIIDKLNDTKFIEQLPNFFIIDKVKNEDIESEFKLKYGENYSLNQFLINSNHHLNDFDIDLKYDFELLNHLFENDQNWELIKKSIIKTNLNELVIKSQISLASSYEKLVKNFCQLNPTKISLEYISITDKLLKFTCEDELSQIGDNNNTEFIQNRVNLSLLISFTISLRKIDDIKRLDKLSLISIIKSCSQLLTSEKLDLFDELITLNKSYFNSLLKILLLSITMMKNQLGDDSSAIIIENSNTFLSIWQNVICKCIEILFSTIRNKAISIPHAEFGKDELVLKQIDYIKLVFELMEKFLSLRFNDSIQEKISNIVIESNTFNSIITLYGVSHLIKINGDEIFGNLSLLFVLEMIKIKLIGKKFISKGIFQILNESIMSQMIQRGGITSYSNDSRIIKLNEIWVQRILPIMLTLITHFQDFILFDICKFVISFKQQFEFTIHSWLESDSIICPMMIEETEQIILLAKILNQFDCYNYISVEMKIKIDEVKLIPGLDSFDERKTFVNVLNYLLSHPKYLSSKIRSYGVSNDEITKSIVDLKELLLS